MTTRILTNISTAYWCSGKGKFEKAVLRTKREKGQREDQTSWFDMLFGGGIVLPVLEGDSHRALTILLTGPPGSGKSTLALELCHRLSETNQVDTDNEGRRVEKKVTWSSLFFTSETNYSWAKQKAESFGWKKYPDSAKKGGKKSEFTPFPRTVIWELSEFSKHFRPGTNGMVDFIKGIIDFIASGSGEKLGNLINNKWAENSLKKKGLGDKPDVLVIDSLNTVDTPYQSELFNMFINLIENGPKVILLIIESDSIQERAKYWEYLSDIVIRLDRTDSSGYSLRTIELLKARYQSHVLGKHQLKIYPPMKVSGLSPEERKRAHPYREEGGIFIYPSIHYHMSIYKRFLSDKEKKKEQLEAINSFPTPIKSLNEILHGGFPEGRCIGLIGGRGGHKSHLAYHCLLYRIIKTKGRNSKGLIISLRDDEDIAKATMNKILEQDKELKNHNLEDLIQNDKLEILYYPPGYIAPEEFFHQMMMSVHRLKFNPSDKEIENDVTVIFNSLDQLSSRFPLCTQEDIFIPGIIKALTVENITSFFIGVNEPGQPQEQYGLLSMADALFTFTRESIPIKNYMGHIEESRRKSESQLGGELAVQEKGWKKIENKLPQIVPTVTMRVTRYAGGQAAGAGGILELVKDDSAIYEIYNQEGLQFIPFSHKFSESEVK